SIWSANSANRRLALAAVVRNGKSTPLKATTETVGISSAGACCLQAQFFLSAPLLLAFASTDSCELRREQFGQCSMDFVEAADATYFARQQHGAKVPMIFRMQAATAEALIHRLITSVDSLKSGQV